MNQVRTWALIAVICMAAAGSADVAQNSFAHFIPVFSNEQLIVASAVATDPPYNADNSGKTDASAAIQKAMGSVSAHGGGTVFLPAGRYRLDKHLNMPATVTLCGEWVKPEPGQPLSGTVLLAYADKGNPDGPALVSPPNCGHAYVTDLTVYYPEQNPADPVPYPFTIEGRVAYIHDITLVNSYQGILMSDFSGSSVSDIYGTVLTRGLVLKSSCELCSCYNLRLNSDYWIRLPEAAISPADAAKVRAFVSSRLIGVQVGKADGLSFYNADLAEAKTPVLVKMEPDEKNVMVARWSNYGFGGGIGKVSGRRTDVEECGWYFGTHYFDLDNYPELSGKSYSFAPLRQAAKVGPGSIIQAGDFGVKADGTTDDSAALQRALDAAGKSGGETVLLPRGTILLKTPITVPRGVELRGGLGGVVIRPWYNVTTLVIDCGADTPDSENASAAITLAERAGLRGLSVCHAQNLWETDADGKLRIHPYPYAVRGAGRGVYIRDVVLPNAYNGIDLGKPGSRCDDAQVVNVWATALHHGVRVGADSDGVRLQNINIDIGPMESDFRLRSLSPTPSAVEKNNMHKMRMAYLLDNAVDFVFGDCTRLTTFALGGFAPHRFMEFISSANGSRDQGHGGCRDAQFWSSIFDVPQVETARFHAGGKIAFYGLFATGGRDHHLLWAEFDDGFRGKVDVYGLCQQLTFNNHAYTVGPQTLQIHLEHSLTTGRPAQASSFVTGFGPENALDGNPRTMWQTQDGKGPHLLTVELSQPSLVTRWRLQNAGSYMESRYNTRAAELDGSMDGKNYFKIAEFNNNAQYWVDLPVQCDRPVRFVQLRILEAQQPGSLSNRAFVADFDVFGHPE